MSLPAKSPVSALCKRRLIAIAGNPNAGKTTLFNALTGARQKVSNYPGVTVERKAGQLKLAAGETVDVVDLPGCYSLAARSPEEQIAHDVILGEMPGEPKPDLVIVVVDASNLERNLFLTSQLLDLKIPIIVALNMMDVAREQGRKVSAEKLAAALGCPVVPLVARRGEGIHDLLHLIGARPTGECACGGVPRFIDCLPPALEPSVQALAEGLVSSGHAQRETARGEALWLLVSSLEGDDAARISPALSALARRVLNEYQLTPRQVRAIETSARYQYLNDVMCRGVAEGKHRPSRFTDRLDGVLLHKVWGPISFLLVMAFVFQSIFSWASPAMDGIESLMTALAALVGDLLPDGMFKEMLLEGAVAGVGNVLVFLPQILILFLFIGFLEDVGYMARAAFLMDRIMARVGLDGRAFLPLLSSFACAIPGIMATRTIAARKDRLVTILVAPLMSCSARLPVYTLIIGTVFTAEQRLFGVYPIGGLMLLGMYFFSIVAGITMAALFKRTVLRSPRPPLLLELPSYKLPSLKSVLLNLYDRARLFVIRAGTVILAATIILWALMHVPVGHQDFSGFEQRRLSIRSEPALDDAGRNMLLQFVQSEEDAARVQQTLAGKMGKLIEPVIAPLGFDWKIGVGIIASFAAREVFVSGLSVVHGVGGSDEETSSLRDALRGERRTDGSLMFTPLLGLSILVFFVLACQCVSTVAIVRRETGGWRWPAFMIAYMTALAWLGSFAVYQGGRLLGFS
ncbi:MAG: ferrous iron transport protein B [bacterium]|nr:ferrous iron transport protein B [bacterium]